jgi:hypothetical protein
MLLKAHNNQYCVSLAVQVITENELYLISEC